MSKMAYAVLSVFLIQLALVLYGGSTAPPTSVYNLVNGTVSGNLGSPTDIGNMYGLIFTAITAIGAIGIIIGTFFMPNYYVLYAIIVGMFITFGSVIANLAIFLNTQISNISPTFALYITMIIIAPFTIFYLFACVEWVRSNY